MKQFSIGNQSATWHLEMLMKFGLIKEMKIDNNHIYYESSLNTKDIKKSFYLSNDKVRTILEYLNNNSNGHTKSELSNNLKMHLNTVKKLLENLKECKLEVKKKGNLMIIKFYLISDMKELSTVLSVPSIKETSPALAYA